MLGAVGMMDLAYVCEWEKWTKSTYCPSLPLACAWSCRNLIAFTTDLRNDDQGECWLSLPAWDLGVKTMWVGLPGVDPLCLTFADTAWPNLESSWCQSQAIAK